MSAGTSCRHASRGVTLLETLLALAIGGLVLTAAYTAVVRALAVRDHATQRATRLAAARRVLLDVARELEAAAARGFAADSSGLRLTHVDPEPRVSGYGVEDTRLLRRRAAGFAATDDAGPPEVVLDGVQGFTVRCFDRGGWTDGWSGAGAPRAVDLALRLTDGEELRTRVVLPLGGGG